MNMIRAAQIKKYPNGPLTKKTTNKNKNKNTNTTVKHDGQNLDSAR